MLPIFVLSTLSNGSAAVVAKQSANAFFDFHNCMFVVHKMLRYVPMLQEWRVIPCRRKPTLFSSPFDGAIEHQFKCCGFPAYGWALFATLVVQDENLVGTGLTFHPSSDLM